MNVGQLRKALVGLPDDALIYSQVHYEREDQYWNLPLASAGKIPNSNPESFAILMAIPSWMRATLEEEK